jgi:GAF domain-containing protein
VGSASEDRMLLRWELTPVTGAGPAAAVPDEQPGPADRLRASFALLTEQTGALSGCRTLEELRAAVPAAALRLVGAAQHAGLTLVGPRRSRQRTWSSQLADQLDSAQLDARDGPLPTALAGARPAHVDHFSPDQPDGTGTLVAFRGAALAVPLRREGRRVVGALTLYADRPGSFDDSDELLTAALAGFVASEVERHILHQAIGTRQLIGQAVGILVERHRMTPEAAFALLARRSQETNVSLSSIARVMVETGQEPSEISAP